MRTYRCVASQPKLSCLQASGLSGHLTIPHVGQLAARLSRDKILGIFVGQIPLRTSGRQLSPYRDYGRVARQNEAAGAADAAA